VGTDLEMAKEGKGTMRVITDIAKGAPSSSMMVHKEVKPDSCP
jgi:hypothetical protein